MLNVGWVVVIQQHSLQTWCDSSVTAGVLRRSCDSTQEEQEIRKRRRG